MRCCLTLICFLLISCACIKSGVNGTTAPFFAIGDQTNNRILIWHNSLNSFFQPADAVIGQPDMVSNNTGCSATTFASPFPFAYNNASLFLPDYANNRVLIWNTLSFLNGQPADLVLGQPDFVSLTQNNGGVSAASIRGPRGVSVFGQQLFVVHASNNRILIWSPLPTSIHQPANYVVGQTSFSGVGNGTSATQLKGPFTAITDGSHFFVDDRSNNRVLIWNEIPLANQPANIVLGQPDFVSSSVNDTPGNLGAVSAQSLNSPSGGVATDGVHVVVGDALNNRVLIWNSIPTTMQQPADVVIGQPDFVSSAVNNTPGNAGVPSAQSLNGPNGVAIDGIRLYITDNGNNRVLIWNSIPKVNQQPADLVLGQSTMAGSSNTAGGLGALSFGNPVGAVSNLNFWGVNRPGGY